MYYLLSFLLELLDGTLVDTTALVDQMTGCGRLARVDVANDDDVDVGLLLWHGDAFVQQMRKKIMRMGFDFNRRTEKQR